MLFHSFEFLAFFALVFGVYWRLPHRGQNLYLLAASLFFYGSWNARLLGLLVASASIDFLCGLALERASSPRLRRAVLIVSVSSSLAILGFFKYANFFLDSLVTWLGAFGVEAHRPSLAIVLPVGISFYTFQAISYAVDVYRGEIRACRNYLDYLLYITLFPQLVAGPIERATRLLPQVEHPRAPLNLGAKLEGVKLILVGYAQKVAIADVLATHVDRAFSDPGGQGGLGLLLGLYAFAVQIYCDFAGYSNLARGTARLLGFRLMVNFRQPYFATSITEFWRRWHISLSTWLRDYLYISLGGNRRGPARTYVHLLLTMLLGGLWHGASWTFVLWGGLHGTYLAVHKALGSRIPLARFPWIRAVVTFHLVCLAWIFFRAETFGVAREYLLGLTRGSDAPGLAELEIALYLVLSLGLDALLARRRRLSHLAFRHAALEGAFLGALLAWIVFVGENHVVPFVYFQF